ncbi:MAG: hypothetical protein KAY65_10955 [Planctomycetes bacterium]|nr:hypothetical protein [Planctomycetota bacterium]
MKKAILYPILTCTLLLSAGCTNNSLVKRLKDHGVTPSNTTKLKFISSEGAFGGDVYVITEEPEVIKSVWTRIYSATLTNFWVASGDHRVEFYTSKQAKQPAATVMVNGTDAARLEGDYWHHFDEHRKGYYGLWRCPGLERLVTWHLRKEYERRKDGS